MKGIKVPIEGDISPILAEFAKLPGRTDAEMQAVGAAIERQIRTGSVAKAFAELPGVSAGQAKKAANAVSREMERAAAEANRSLGEIKKGATVAFGGIVGDVEDVVGAIGEMGPAGLIAAAGVGALAVEFAAIYAEYKVVSMLYEFADATGELEGEQKALSQAIEETKQAIGTRFVPVFEGMLIGITAGTLAIRDFALRALDAGSAMIQWYQSLGPLAKSLLGNLGGGVMMQADAIDQLSAGLRSGTIDAGGYVAQARAMVSIQDATAEAAKRTTKATERQGAAHSATAKAVQSQADELARLQGSQALAEIEADQELTDQILANIDAISAARTTANEKLDAEQTKLAERTRAAFDAEIEQLATLRAAQRDYYQEVAFSGINTAAQVAQAVADGAEEGSQAQRDAALVAFRLNQAAGIGQIAINTAGAIVKGIELFGPPPSPAGIAAIAAASAIGLAQAALVAAQPPPAFHTGGMISTNPLAPDETMVRARKGEEIRTRQDQSGGAPVVVQMVYQHRVFDSFIADNMRTAGSPLRGAIHKASGRRVGHRG
jgi:hypothetical protein